MTIVTDGIHVTSTTSVTELHEWAEKNGIGRHWFHGVSKGHPHYDLPYRKLGLAKRLKQVNKQDVLAYAKAIILTGKPKRRTKSLADSARNVSKHKFRPGQHVLAKLFVDDGDEEWLHCQIVGRSGTPTNPTYTIKNWEGTRSKLYFPQRYIKLLG